MCFSSPLQSGKAWEQALAREHRPGQKADDVVADVYLGCRETWWAFERSKLDAMAIEATLGQPQRLNKATMLIATTEEVALARCDKHIPMWAETNHAKIDGSLGALRLDAYGKPVLDAAGNPIREKTNTPSLTSLRERAKNHIVDDTDADDTGEEDAEDA
jgi:hypothetical protein